VTTRIAGLFGRSPNQGHSPMFSTLNGAAEPSPHSRRLSRYDGPENDRKKTKFEMFVTRSFRVNESGIGNEKKEA
jgi:hypothetical protein